MSDIISKKPTEVNTQYFQVVYYIVQFNTFFPQTMSTGQNHVDLYYKMLYYQEQIIN